MECEPLWVQDGHQVEVDRLRRHRRHRYHLVKVVEVVLEELGVAQQATNTSSLPLDELGQVLEFQTGKLEHQRADSQAQHSQTWFQTWETRNVS